MNTVLIEAHPLVRTGMTHLLSTLRRSPGVTLVDPDEAMFDAVAAHAEDALLVVGLPLPEFDECAAIKGIMVGPHPHHVVALAELASPDLIFSLMQCGLSGYVHRHWSSEVITASLELVLAGERYVPANALLSMSCPNRPRDPATHGDPGRDPQLLGLTLRQYEVLVLLSRGHPVKTISRRLNMAEATVKSHISTVYRRLKVRNRTEAVYVANQRGAHLMSVV